jgi:hypothetical protein
MTMIVDENGRTIPLQSHFFGRILPARIVIWDRFGLRPLFASLRELGCQLLEHNGIRWTAEDKEKTIRTLASKLWPLAYLRSLKYPWNYGIYIIHVILPSPSSTPSYDAPLKLIISFFSLLFFTSPQNNLHLIGICKVSSAM